MGSYMEELTVQLNAVYDLKETMYTLEEQRGKIPAAAAHTQMAVRLEGEIEELRQILVPLEGELREGLQLLMTNVQKTITERGGKQPITNITHNHRGREGRGRLEYQITGEGEFQSQLVTFNNCDDYGCGCYAVVNPHPQRQPAQSMASEDLVDFILAGRGNEYMYRGLSRILET